MVEVTHDCCFGIDMRVARRCAAEDQRGRCGVESSPARAATGLKRKGRMLETLLERKQGGLGSVSSYD